MMQVSTSEENYLKAIFILKKNDVTVREIDVAHCLGYSKPSVSFAVKKLEQREYIFVKADHSLELTDAGRKIAETTYAKYCFFVNALITFGVPPKQAEEDAHRLEHAISRESFERLMAAHSTAQ